PVLADQETEVTAGEGGDESLVVLLDRQPGMHADLTDDPPEELAHVGGKLALVDHFCGSVAVPVPVAFRRYRRDHASRSKTDTEQAALALGDHLELDRRLVEPGLELFELAQRRPLCLADRLPRRFDLELLVHRRARFLRLTFRGCEGAAARAVAGSFAAPSPAGSSFDGVRDERRCGWAAGVLCVNRRVTRPWPTVPR